MNRWFKLMLILLGAGLGLLVGFALRSSIKPGDHPQAASAQTTNRPGLARFSEPKPTQRQRQDESPVASELQRALVMSSGVTQWLCWMDAFEKAAPADFPRLLALARGNSTATRFLANRWAEIAPRHLFDTLKNASRGNSDLPVQQLVNALFNYWPRHEPQAAIAALNEPGDFGQRHEWRMLVAGRICERDTEVGLKLMADWHIENYGPNLHAVEAWALSDPRHAAEFTLEHPAGYVSQLTMEGVARVWAKMDPAAALAFAASKPGELGSLLAATTLKEWAGRNLDQASQWLAAADNKTRDQLSPAFLEAWARQDPGAALAWSQENLEGSRLVRAVSGLINGASEKDIPAAAAMVSTLEPSAGRAEAAAIVARKWFPESDSSEEAKSQSIEWLRSLDPDSVRRALDQIAWQWSTADPKSMASFLSTLGGDKIPPNVASSLAQQMACKDPIGTLEWAARLSPECGLAAGGEAFAEWRKSQPEAAMRWLQELAADDTRREPFFQTAIRSLAYDPQSSQQLASLPEPDRAAARKVIAAMTLPEERRTALLDLLTKH